MRQPIWIIAATLSELHYNTFYRIISATKNIFNHCSVRLSDYARNSQDFLQKWNLASLKDWREAGESGQCEWSVGQRMRDEDWHASSYHQLIRISDFHIVIMFLLRKFLCLLSSMFSYLRSYVSQTLHFPQITRKIIKLKNIFQHKLWDCWVEFHLLVGDYIKNQFMVGLQRLHSKLDFLMWVEMWEERRRLNIELHALTALTSFLIRLTLTIKHFQSDPSESIWVNLS